MRDSRRSQKDSLWTCALQHKTLNQLRNPNKLLQATLYVCNNLFINCSLFDLASTFFTHYRKFFKKFVFLASPKTRFVTLPIVVPIALASFTLAFAKTMARSSAGAPATGSQVHLKTDWNQPFRTTLQIRNKRLEK